MRKLSNNNYYKKKFNKMHLLDICTTYLNFLFEGDCLFTYKFDFFLIICDSIFFFSFSLEKEKNSLIPS